MASHRDAGRRALIAVAAAVGAMLLVLLVAIGASSMAPLRISCAPGLDDDLCHQTVGASLERGLAPFHPLILTAYAEPGEAPGPAQIGHRATVTFDLLGVPGPTTVALYYDIGAHWGGVTSRTAPELAAQALLAAALAVGAVALLIGLVNRIARRHHQAIQAEGAAGKT